MKSLILFAIITLAIACSKHGKNKRDCDAYWISVMQEKWKVLSNCGPEYNPYLGKGIYQRKLIYYTSVQCLYCKMPPPKVAINCNGDSINVKSWEDVKNTQIIATCSNR